MASTSRMTTCWPPGALRTGPTVLRELAKVKAFEPRHMGTGFTSSSLGTYPVLLLPALLFGAHELACEGHTSGTWGPAAWPPRGACVGLCESRPAGAPGSCSRLTPPQRRPQVLTFSSPHLVPSGTGSYWVLRTLPSAWQDARWDERVQEVRSGGFHPPSQNRTPHVSALWTEGLRVEPALLGPTDPAWGAPRSCGR